MHGAAPGTRFDGAMLADPPIEGGIGGSQRKVEVWDLGPDAFSGGEDVLEDEPG